MFARETVIIIGAGAGQDIDMPVGSVLNEEITKKLGHSGNVNEYTDRALQHLSARKGLNQASLQVACKQIGLGINYTDSIDNFIHKHSHNPSIKAAGKVAIAQTILEYERKSGIFVDPQKHPPKFKNENGVRKSWLHDLMRILQAGVVVKQNMNAIFDKLFVVNFNYDRCIEHFLWRALQDSHFLDTNEVSALMNSKFKIHHPYGTIGNLPWQSSDGLPFGEEMDRADLVALSDNIKTYNEEVAESKELEEAHDRISRADSLIFVGFHFHQQNVGLITPKRPIKDDRQRAVYATVLGRSQPARDVIEGQVLRMMERSSSAWHRYYEDMKCKDMFLKYDTVFMGR